MGKKRKAKSRDALFHRNFGEIVRLYSHQLRSGKFSLKDKIKLRKEPFEIIDAVMHNSKSLPLSHRKLVAVACAPESYENVFAGRLDWNIDCLKLRREIHWACCVCHLLSDYLNPILQLRYEYFQLLMTGQYNECQVKLRQISNKYGFSIWMLRSEPVIAQLNEGLAGNKRWLRTLHLSNTNDRVKYLAHGFSFLAEDTTSVVVYEQVFRAALANEKKKDVPICQYLLTELLPFGKGLESDLSQYLECQNTNSLLDLHDALLRVIVNLCARGNVAELSPKTLPYISSLSLTIKDQRWPLIHNLINPKELVDDCMIKEKIISLLNYYTIGDFGAVIEVAEGCIGMGYFDLDICELYVRAIIANNKCSSTLIKNMQIGQDESLIRNLLLDMVKTVKKEASSSRSIQKLKKNAYLLLGYSFAEALYAICSLESLQTTSDPYSVYWHRLRLLNQHGGTPQFSLLYGNNDDKMTYLNTWVSRFGWQKCLSPFLTDPNTDTICSGFQKRRNSLYKAELFYAEKDYNNACIILQSLQREGGLYCFERERVIKCLIECYRITNRSFKELHLIVVAILENPYMLNSIDLDDIHARLKGKVFDTVAMALEYSIFFHWCQKQLPSNKQDAYDLYACYAMVLEVGGYQSVIDLTKSYADSGVDRFAVNYYFKNVCCIATLANDWNICSQEEKELIRIKICDFLVLNDAENAELYQKEALQLLRNAEVRKRVKTVDESRIFVDVVRITDRLRDALDEEFNRLMSLMKLAPDLRSESYSKLDDLVSEKPRHSKNYENSQDAAFLVFASLFEAFARDFLLHDEFGLDYYLSNRIRHGVVDIELRSVFENCKLVTKKSGDDYLKNEYWQSQFPDICEEEQASLETGLAKLSQQVDSSIAQVQKSWVQVAFSTAITSVSNVDELLRSLKKINNGFDFRFSFDEIIGFFDDCPQCETIDDFAEYAFKIMWQRTEKCMAELRMRIEQELSRELSDLLDFFENDIRDLNGINAPSLKTLVTQCRSEIPRTTSRISNWFRLSDKYLFEAYNLETMITTCLTILQNRNLNFFRNVNVQCSDTRLYSGDTFLSFVDILLLLLGNILKHAPDQMDTTYIKVYDGDENNVILSVSNEIDSIVDPALLSSELKNIGGDYDQSSLRTEGKSGFMKLQKHLRDLAHLKATLYSELSGRTFTAKISFTRQGVS